MKVTIAGFNIDKSLIDTLPDQNSVSPETISAAYARISRSKKSVTELREDSIKQVEKARKSNESIIFEMGHSSIAEHAVFNFDIIGVSRLLVETIQRTRLASFTEKSQRYVTLDGDYVIPDEIKNTALEEKFIKIIETQNVLYSKLYKKGKQHLEDAGYSAPKRELQGKAKEDARYILALATQTQLGMTINARSIAKLLRRLDSTDLVEARQLKNEIEQQVKKIAPSLVRYTNADEYEKNFINRLPKLDVIPDPNQDVVLLGHSVRPEESILASLFFERYGYDPTLILMKIQHLTEQEKEDIFDSVLKGMKSYNAVPRAFEIAYFTFHLTMSSSCFGQLKRHRMSTIIRCDYDPREGYKIPPLISELNVELEIEQVMKQVSELYYEMENIKKGLGNYILTNAHKISVIFKANLRELYHFSRLRSDGHAQWEIRELSLKMDEIIKQIAPFAAKLMMGKDEFEKK